MKFVALVVGWGLVLAGVAAVAIVAEILLHRRRVLREAQLHRRLGVGTAAGRR